MSALPLVSFIIPAYNAAPYIHQTVTSVLNQTYPNVEVVIVDDGSPDNTGDVVKQHFGDDARVRYFRQANGGPSTARNRAIQEARGEFVHFLDADEYLLPTKVEKSYALFVQHPEIAVVYGHGIPVKPDGVTEIPMDYPPLPSGDVFCEWLIGTMSGGTYGVVSSVMARRAAVLEVGGFNVNIKGTEDWDCWLRLAAKYHFAALDERLIYYRRIADGVHANRLNMAKSRLQTYQLARGYNQSRPPEKRCLDDAGFDRLLASRWQVVAARHWESGDRAAAREAFSEALRLHPRPIRYLYYALTYVAPYQAMATIDRWRGGSKST